MIRQPIISVLGHVDHGKTTILDRIRGTVVQKKEAGGITQHIGATEVPSDTIKNICEDLIKRMKLDLKIPGLLFIDTPGHEAFSSLRRRGGSIADLAVLVVDINEGLMPQTRESINILKSGKVPFIIAANKIDLVPGWRGKEGFCIEKSMKEQGKGAIERMQEKVYSLMNQLAAEGFDSEMYDSADFEKQLAIVPVSGKTGEGIAELLVLLSGMAQRYLEKNLKIEVEGPGRGNVLEIKEVTGLGKTMDVILYDGSLEPGDKIAVGAVPAPITTTIRAILKPNPLKELREKGGFQKVKKVHAASGIKLACRNTEGVVAGMPLVEVVGSEKDEIQELKKDIETVVFSKEAHGVIVKSDSIGGLEAMLSILKQKGVPVKKADIGEINKEDIIEAKSISEKQLYLGVVFGFNVGQNHQAKELSSDYKTKVFTSNIIYKIVEDYEGWRDMEKERREMESLKQVCMPFRISVLPGFVFRQNKPAVVGVEVNEGTVRTGATVINPEGKEIGLVKDIQDSGRRVEKAERGERVAVSIEGGFVGKNIHGGDILISDLSEREYKKLKEHKNILSKEDMDIIKQVVDIKRNENPLWGIN